MSDSSGKEDHEPRWDIIEKLHDKIDGDISEALRVNRMSFIEIDIALKVKYSLNNLFHFHTSRAFE